MGTNENRRVLGIVGSPRRGGNTETLVDEVLRGAEEHGAETEKVILNELDIRPCQACNSCRNTGICIQKDDMAELLERMRASETWVLGTPVYWWGPSAQFKTFVDRWYSQMDEEPKAALFEGRRVILAIPLGSPEAETARHTLGMLQNALAHTGPTIHAELLAPGFNERGAVREDENLMQRAYRAGQEVAEGTA
jgi:multimeric flavodoxin WrbA